MNQSDFIKRFGMRVEQLRKEKGLSYRTMAQLCDVDYSDISKIEKGQINITLGTVLELSKALGVEVRELFGFPTREN